MIYFVDLDMLDQVIEVDPFEFELRQMNVLIPIEHTLVDYKFRIWLRKLFNAKKQNLLLTPLIFLASLNDFACLAWIMIFLMELF